MDTSLIVTGAITIAAIGTIFYINGWRKGLRRVGFIFIFLAIYIFTVYFFGRTGKEYLAVFLVLAACVVLYVRKKNSQKIW